MGPFSKKRGDRSCRLMQLPRRGGRDRGFISEIRGEKSDPAGIYDDYRKSRCLGICIAFEIGSKILRPVKYSARGVKSVWPMLVLKWKLVNGYTGLHLFSQILVGSMATPLSKLIIIVNSVSAMWRVRFTVHKSTKFSEHAWSMPLVNRKTHYYRDTLYCWSILSIPKGWTMIKHFWNS